MSLTTELNLKNTWAKEKDMTWNGRRRFRTI